MSQEVVFQASDGKWWRGPGHVRAYMQGFTSVDVYEDVVERADRRWIEDHGDYQDIICEKGDLRVVGRRSHGEKAFYLYEAGNIASFNTKQKPDHE